MTRYRNLNGKTIAFTAEEEAERDAEEKEYLDSIPVRKLEELRNERNKRIAETDHYGLSDQTMSSDMITYRQALRDITDSATSLDDVTWPTKP